jgi:hypothetical protein
MKLDHAPSSDRGLSPKTSRAAKPSLVVKLAVVGILGIGLFYANQYSAQLVQDISHLPVQGVAVAVQEDSPAPAVRQETLYPLLAESTKKANEWRQATGGVPINLDQLFGQVPRSAQPAPAATIEEPKAAPPPVFDGFAAVRSLALLQALSPQGAVINDTYVEVGKPVTSLGYPSPDGQRTLYPTLVAKGGDWVELREAQGRRTLRLKLF